MVFTTAESLIGPFLAECSEKWDRHFVGVKGYPFIETVAGVHTPEPIKVMVAPQTWKIHGIRFTLINFRVNRKVIFLIVSAIQF